MTSIVRIAVVTVVASAVAGCSLFSQTPDAGRRSEIRSTVPYGMTIDTAESKLSGLGFACSRRGGNYLDESGTTRSAERFLACEERPGVVSFACENRDQVTVVEREGVVSGIEVTRGPSCTQPETPNRTAPYRARYE